MKLENTLYEPTAVTKIHPIKDHVLVSEMNFAERFTATGIIILNDNGKSEGIRPRWGRVYAVGPDQTDVQVGQWVLVAHGRWTRGSQITENGATITIRRICNDDMLLVSDTQPLDETFSTAVSAPAKSR